MRARRASRESRTRSARSSSRASPSSVASKSASRISDDRGCVHSPSMNDADTVDVALIGAGIMSATFGTMFLELEPTARIAIFERLDHAAAESSDAWNNAGTGHAGYCELNYTPRAKDGG